MITSIVFVNRGDLFWKLAVFSRVSLRDVAFSLTRIARGSLLTDKIDQRLKGLAGRKGARRLEIGVNGTYCSAAVVNPAWTGGLRLASDLLGASASGVSQALLTRKEKKKGLVKISVR